MSFLLSSTFYKHWKRTFITIFINYYINITSEPDFDTYTNAPLAIRNSQYKLVPDYTDNSSSQWYDYTEILDDDSDIDSGTGWEVDALSFRPSKRPVRDDQPLRRIRIHRHPIRGTDSHSNTPYVRPLSLSLPLTLSLSFSHTLT